MKLHERLAALESSPVPTWVFDLDFFRQRWANKPALELWRASTPEELYARDYSDMSESTRTRMRGYIDGFRVGRTAEEEWTLYPKGEPVTMKLFMTGVPLDDGRTGVLIQAVVKEKAPSPDLVRSIEALRHTSVMVTLLDMEGEIVLQNPAAQSAFGTAAPFRARFPDDVIPEALLSATRAGEVFSLETAVHTAVGERWHAVEARTLPDPATGKTVILVHHTDETARRGAERRAAEEGQLAEQLRGTLAIVERQKQEILALSAPVLEVSSRTIALPIIGVLDSARALEMEGRILNAVSARGAETVILDLTGADALTAETAEQVARLGRAIRLLGARPIATGITSKLARTLVHANVDLEGILLLRSLRDGIEAARCERT
ncbi:STAS domain-containing protein [Polyangium jinanense]|uniref:STAS domain-containing protein n=1 Tax=Polyangium jinanense TaxID=2829994 RepID=A0A9X4B0X8_9BACT|nr:STAS domain-containing protein [Polyangium jinanense]MDC3962912.1 STAS domain-containing protein [Polyangium jinanense]MDC3989602.1 STAS domain-containing protein [Polyangium jinanense]